MKSFLVKVRRCGTGKWSHTIHIFAESYGDAERQAKSIYGKEIDCRVGDIDAKAIREDAKSTWKRPIKPHS